MGGIGNIVSDVVGGAEQLGGQLLQGVGSLASNPLVDTVASAVGFPELGMAEVFSVN